MKGQYPFLRDNPKQTRPYPPLPPKNTIEAYHGQYPLKGCQPWTIWQFTARGVVPGIAGDVDQNLFKGGLDDLRGWTSKA